MSSHILAEVDRLATRVGIVHRGRLIEELGASALARHRDRRLEVAARDLPAVRRTLEAAGFAPADGALDDGTAIIELREPRALDAPEEIARLLVAAGAPPSRLAITRETLEDHFVRLTGGADGAAR